MGLYGMKCREGHAYTWWSGNENVCPVCNPQWVQEMGKRHDQFSKEVAPFIEARVKSKAG